jgi:hypothetical protein
MSIAVQERATARARARQRLGIVVVGLCVIATPGSAASSNPVLEWNDIARGLIVVPAFAPVQQARAMAIVQVAVHDAVSGVTQQYEQYHPTGVAPAGATPEASAIAAAYNALKGVLGPSASLDAQFLASLESHAIAHSDPGLAFGQAVADGIVALRQDDGASLAAYPYVAPGAGMPGVWTPTSSAPGAQALLPGWGNVTPFVLRSASQFRPDAPPALDSERYARDYNEVLQLGAAGDPARTDDAKQIALFWRASPTALWNPILRTAIQARQMDLSATARVIALFYLASSDASVACWESKYLYNFWRPQAAIINGDHDGNSLTAGNAAWMPLLPTPPHPEYLSGHTSNSSAMAFVLQSFFGDAPGYVIEATSPQNVGFVRRWNTFSEGVDEVILARVYSGIHFRTADEVGARVGRQVAQFVMKHALRPMRGNSKKARSM